MAKIRWNGNKVQREMRRTVVLALRKGSDLAKTLIQREIRQPARSGSGGARSPKKGAGPPMQFNRSKPGEPPKADTGRLIRSIFARVYPSRLHARVGTNVKYGVYLEEGVEGGKLIVPVRKKVLCFPVAGAWIMRPRVTQGEIKARPFIRKTINKNWRTRIWPVMAKRMRAAGYLGRGKFFRVQK